MEPGLQQYLRQINESPLLTAEEEKDLARAITRGSSAAERFAKGELSLTERERFEEEGNLARERMIRSNLRLVVNIAKPFGNRGMNLSDLIEEGNLGLLRAVEGFDPDMGARFSTYASWWIKQSIKRALINTVQPVHIPAYMVELIARWKQVNAELLEETGRAPNIQEIAERMQVTEKKVRFIRRAVRAYSAPTQASAADGGPLHADMLPDQKMLSPDELVHGNAEDERVAMFMADLDERQQDILRMHYGLDGEEPMSFRDIGAKIGLTRERVRQLEADALQKLQQAMADS